MKKMWLNINYKIQLVSMVYVIAVIILELLQML